MSKQGPEFYSNLERFREMKLAVHNRCQEYQEWEEDLHRKALLETPGLSAERRECHLMQLDSKGFVKVLKRRSSIQTRECRTVSVFPMKHLTLSYAPGIQADVIINFAYRNAFKRDLRVLIPAADVDTSATLWWPNVSATGTAFDAFSDKPAQVAAESFAPFANSGIASLAPGYYTIAIMEDPVQHFRRLWDAGLADRKAEGLGDITIRKFLEQTHRYKEHPAFEQLYNPQFYHFCGARVGSAAQVKKCIQTMYQQFRKVLITDNLLNSMILLRREVCWEREDIIHPSIPVGKEPVAQEQQAIPKTLAAKIQAFNAADYGLYLKSSKRLQRQISQELAWEEEVSEMTQWVKEARSFCGRLKTMDQEELIAAVSTVQEVKFYPLDETACHLHYLTAESFRQVFRNVYASN